MGKIVIDFSFYNMILYIVHGSSNDWQDLEDCLVNHMKLPKPVVMQVIFGESKTLSEKFEDLASKAHGSIILATPDDIGGKIASSTGEVIEKNYRARQNVWLEIGWFWGRLGRDHLMILVREKPS